MADFRTYSGRLKNGSSTCTAVSYGLSTRSTRWRRGWSSVAPVATPFGHSVVRLASGDDRLTFLGDALFPNHFDHPDWHNAFDHDPEEAVRVRVGLLKELAKTREPLLAAHLPFPSVGRVAAAGSVFRFIPADWEY